MISFPSFGCPRDSITSCGKSIFLQVILTPRPSVIVVGASISGPDIAYALADVAETPLNCVVRGKYHPYFFDFAFQHPNILRQPPITHIVSNRDTDERTVFFEDGTKLENVDHIIFGTGYSWTMPFFPELAATIRNNRLPNLYQHIFWREDPTLCFVGAVAAGVKNKFLCPSASETLSQGSRSMFRGSCSCSFSILHC